MIGPYPGSNLAQLLTTQEEYLIDAADISTDIIRCFHLSDGRADNHADRICSTDHHQRDHRCQ